MDAAYEICGKSQSACRRRCCSAGGGVKCVMTLALAGMLLLSACAHDLSEKTTGPHGKKPVFYRCDSGRSIVVWFEPEQVQLQMEPDGKARTLAAVPAASGARYSDGILSFWTKGSDAVVEQGGKVMVGGCKRNAEQQNN